MLPTKAIFRAYDIRGVVADALTPDAVTQIGQAFASECLDKGLTKAVVARDGRTSGPDLIEALSNGMQAAGLEVIDIGMVPTPVLYYATFALETGTGVMVTGSHNPPEYNGLKMVLDGAALYGDGIMNLYNRIEKGDLKTGTGGYSRADIFDDYLNRILGDVKLKRKMKLAYDCGNGVTGMAAPALFDGLDCDSQGLFTHVDGNFPNHHPDPAKLENLQDLIKVVLDNKLELGLAFDGDGDRVGIVDDKGQVIWPDRQMVLYAQDVLSRNPGAKIIYDVKCSKVLPAAITEAGGEPEMWKTGHSFIKARIKETGALLGGEMSGHIFFKERWYGFDDALYSAARLLEILSGIDRPVSDIFGDIPDSINTPEITVTLDRDGAQHEFVEAFAKNATFEGATLTTIDGVRADYEDGWGLLRASNTTPSLVIRFEADTEEALGRIQTEFKKVMQQTDSKVTIPF